MEVQCPIPRLSLWVLAFVCLNIVLIAKIMPMYGIEPFYGIISSGNFSGEEDRNPLYQYRWLGTRTEDSNITISNINCSAMFQGNQVSIQQAIHHMATTKQNKLSTLQYVNLANNCTSFKTTRGYFLKPLSEEERDFPLAYTILAYKDIEQIERLLRVIYQPQNFYCIHMDKEATPRDIDGIRTIANCFQNVFVPQQLIKVFWGHLSILQAERICLEILIKYRWKYHINLSAQMFPVHSNYELVNILKIYNGSNDVEGTVKRNQDKYRIEYRHKLMGSRLVRTKVKKSAPPHNLTIYKGSEQSTISYEFAVFSLRSKVALDLLEYLSDTSMPEEFFYPTLNHNPHIEAPGGFTGDPETKIFTTRASIWDPISQELAWSWRKRGCTGKWVRFICVLGVGDLPWMYRRPELFVNKLHYDYQWLAYDCLEKLIHERTTRSYVSEFYPGYYKNLSFVNHARLKVK